MASASGGLLFINGVGAVTGPVITGWIMSVIGPSGFWLFVAGLMLTLAAYAAYRMTRRKIKGQERGAYVGVSPSASAVTLEAATEWAIDAAEEEHNTEQPS